MIKYLTLMILTVIAASGLYAKKTTLVEIDGIIDNGVAYFVERSIMSASESGSEMIIFDINTLGGRVDSAIKIKDHIINSPLKTIAYINKRAISAGALISLSCDLIVMAEGSSIGAATVVDQTGEKQSEKSQSYFRSEIASTAERTGRDKDIARAMVDEDIAIDGIVEKGKLLTLTSEEALEVGFCDTVVQNNDQLYSYLGTTVSEVDFAVISFGERVVRFLTNPVISSLLMTLAFLGLIFEVRTAGWGVGGTIGLVALALFFGSHYVIDLLGNVEIILFLAGSILIMLEILVVPGFGVTGISGLIAILASFYFTLLDNNPTGSDLINAGAVLSGSFILTVAGIYVMSKYLPDSKFLDFVVVRNRQERGWGVKNSKYLLELSGKSGKAATDLRLSGKIEVEGQIYHAQSADSYISSGEKIKVLKIVGNKVIVTADKS
ncbi:MAG: NfeD family protein [Candidatus Delongbacteria bacterium]